jgi:hypothetical protein
VFDRAAKYQDLGTYSFLTIERYISSQAKLAQKCGCEEEAMKLKDQLLANVSTVVNAKREKVASKRRGRRTLADMSALFIQSWERGQRESDSTTIPTRIVNKDRALLKSQLLKAFQRTEIDIEDFAYWCANKWDAIGANYFTKSKKYPTTPAFRWLVACLEIYVQAYDNREFMDDTAKHTPDRLRTATKRDNEKLQSIATVSATELADAKRELAQLTAENQKLRDGKGMEPDDDPVYSNLIKTAKRKIVIGSYEEKPKLRIKRRKKT